MNAINAIHAGDQSEEMTRKLNTKEGARDSVKYAQNFRDKYKRCFFNQILRQNIEVTERKCKHLTYVELYFTLIYLQMIMQYLVSCGVEVLINPKTVKETLPNKLLAWLVRTYRKLDREYLNEPEVIENIFNGKFSWVGVQLDYVTIQSFEIYLHEAEANM